MVEMKIQLKVKDIIIELTVDELNELHDTIHNLVNEKYIPYPYPNPITPCPNDWWRYPIITYFNDSIYKRPETVSTYDSTYKTDYTAPI